jgi:hypothetical protein
VLATIAIGACSVSPSSSSDVPVEAAVGVATGVVAFVTMLGALLIDASSSSRIAESDGWRREAAGGCKLPVSWRVEVDSSSVEEIEDESSEWPEVWLMWLVVLGGVVEGVEVVDDGAEERAGELLLRMGVGEEGSMSMGGTWFSPPGMGRFSIKVKINSFSLVLFSSKLAGSDDIDLHTTIRTEEREGRGIEGIPKETGSKHHSKVVDAHLVDVLVLRDITQQLDDEA